jgi:hypothetical protein
LNGTAKPLLCGHYAALVAQLDRASDFESEGREFESLRARQHLDGVVGNVLGNLLGIAFPTLFTGDGIVVADPKSRRIFLVAVSDPRASYAASCLDVRLDVVALGGLQVRMLQMFRRILKRSPKVAERGVEELEGTAEWEAFKKRLLQ